MQDKLIIHGLERSNILEGEIYIQGAKNASLKTMASSILFDGEIEIQNVPKTTDILNLEKLLLGLGAKTRWEQNTIFIDTSNVDKDKVLDKELATNMRASVVLTGPLLARFKRVVFPSPGGCVIGARPIDLFLNSFEKMGATVEYDGQNFIIESKDGLTGTQIFFPLQSVGATETIMMSAVLTKGQTVLKNCALEPEIVSLGEFLISNGANIKGLGTTTIVIEGGALLKAKNPSKTIPDRIEAGSYMILGALCGKTVEIKGINSDHLDSLTQLLLKSGTNLSFRANGELSDCIVSASKDIQPFDIRTHEYPGFPTDLQAPVVTYLSLANGDSRVFETIYESRFKYIDDLISMGARIDVLNSREINVHGVTQFVAPKNPIEVKDIRAGFAVILGALCAKGDTEISNIKLVDRGYEDIVGKLSKIGAKIQRLG